MHICYGVFKFICKVDRKAGKEIDLNLSVMRKYIEHLCEFTLILSFEFGKLLRILYIFLLDMVFNAYISM